MFGLVLATVCLLYYKLFVFCTYKCNCVAEALRRARNVQVKLFQDRHDQKKECKALNWTLLHIFHLILFFANIKSERLFDLVDFFKLRLKQSWDCIPQKIFAQ